MPRLGIEPATFWRTGRHASQLSRTGRAGATSHWFLTRKGEGVTYRQSPAPRWVSAPRRTLVVRTDAGPTSRLSEGKLKWRWPPSRRAAVFLAPRNPRVLPWVTPRSVPRWSPEVTRTHTPDVAPSGRALHRQQQVWDSGSRDLRPTGHPPSVSGDCSSVCFHFCPDLITGVRSPVQLMVAAHRGTGVKLRDSLVQRCVPLNRPVRAEQTFVGRISD